MIWIRRFLANILFSAIIALFMLFMVLFRVNDTFGNPDFYIDQLQQADVYNFIYDEAMPAVLEERLKDVELDGTTIELTKFKANLVSSAKQVFPPEWIQARVEDVIGETLPYLLGDTEGFSVTIPLKGRVTQLGDTLKETVYDEDVFPELYEAAVAHAVNQGMKGLEDAPFSINLTREEMESAVRTLVPQAWLQTQLDGAVDELVPYMTGEAEHFEVVIEFRSRMRAAGEIAVDLMGRPETYDYLFDEMVASMIADQIGSFVELPYGITVTQEEVVGAFKEILPQPWFKEQVEGIVEEAVSYIDGTSDTFDVSIPLADREAAALEVVERMAERKLDQVLASLPTCTPEEALELLQDPPPFGELPPCKPADLSAEQLRQILGIDLGPLIIENIGIPIPDSFRFTKDDLARITDVEGDETFLDQARRYAADGWRYTDADLREDLSQEDVKRLDDARGRIREGFTFTEQNLREAFDEFAQGDVPIKDIDQVREWLGLARRWSSVLGWLVLGVLSASVGFLAGRNWRSRLAWAVVPLVVASAIVYVLFGPVYGRWARPAMEPAIRNIVGEMDGLFRVFVEKGITVGQNIVDSFVAGIASQALVVLIVTGLVMAGAVTLQIVRRRGRS